MILEGSVRAPLPMASLKNHYGKDSVPHNKRLKIDSTYA